jgi:hypothetical protein
MVLRLKGSVGPFCHLQKPIGNGIDLQDEGVGAVSADSRGQIRGSAL